MIPRPPRSTPLYSSAASDVYKRQGHVPLLIGARAEQFQVLDQLLRQRGGALDSSASNEVRVCCADHRVAVNPAVVPEATVLDGHDRVDQQRGHFVEGDGLTVLRIELCDDVAGI